MGSDLAGASMAQLIWDDRLATGHPLIDAQHAELHDLVMELGILAERDEDRLRLGDVLFEILSYAATHFREEEALMDAVGFPGLARQRKLHHAFAVKLARASKLFAQGDSEISASGLWRELNDWLLHHVWDEDMQLAEFLRSRGN